MLKYLWPLFGLLCGSSYYANYAVAAEQVQLPAATIVIQDCWRQPEWIGIATPKGWRLLHVSTINPETLKEFLDTYKPEAIRPPAEVCL